MSADTLDIQDEIIDLELELLTVTDIDAKIDSYGPVNCATWTSGL
ncbi:hypothetical protein ABIA33_007557 [Streptacidiphilus sp. MAP12-16]|jgi:hypothetical protein